MAAAPGAVDAAHLLREGLAARRDALCRTIRSTRLLAVALVALTIMAGYGLGAGSRVFVAVLILFSLQLFDTGSYRELLALDRRMRGVRVGAVRDRSRASWFAAAGIAVARGYFILFLCFDLAWLLSAYLVPSPAAASYAEYLERLRFGPVSGEGFIIFTLVFWVVYFLLLIVGLYRGDEIAWRGGIGTVDIAGQGGGPERGEFSLEVPAPGGAFLLHGVRMPNPGRQPLILWPGFYQNGLVYDLAPGEKSLAEYLWRAGYDIWIIHSRGTDRSGGAWRDASLDDYAALDIPAAISHVRSRTGTRPLYVGHSQGGITAIMSMMGAHKGRDGGMSLSDREAHLRQESLAGLVTLGSFLDFTFSHRSGVQDLVKNGIGFTILGQRIRIISGEVLLAILKPLRYYPVPVGRMLRRGILRHGAVRILCVPVTAIVYLVAGLGLWEFLYHIPNVGRHARRALFCNTIDATYHGILLQFFRAVRDGEMRSLDGRVNYSAGYGRLHLPVSFVTMEYDSLADPVMVERSMYAAVSSSRKFFTEWKGMGHEDHFMNPTFFRRVLDAIKMIDP